MARLRNNGVILEKVLGGLLIESTCQTVRAGRFGY